MSRYGKGTYALSTLENASRCHYVLAYEAFVGKRAHDVYPFIQFRHLKTRDDVLLRLAYVEVIRLCTYRFNISVQYSFST